jgi:SnoaL-like domain
MSTTDLLSLDAQIRRLNDRQAVAELITRLGLMLDDKHFDEARAILADDVVVRTPGGSAQGLEAVLEQARRNHTVRTQHVITDLLIDLEVDRAEASANLIVTFVPGSARPGSRLAIGTSEPVSRLMIGERYRFEAARGESGWRLTTIEVTRLWSTEPLAPGARVAEIDRDVVAMTS